MNLCLRDDGQNFDHNIKQEPEEEFLCILPSFDNGIIDQENLVHVKQETEIQSEEIPKFQCKICQKIFGSNHYLKEHEKIHQKQQCKVCNRKFPLKSFEKHMKSHQNERTERKFECKICSHRFLINWQLNHHVLIHLRRFQCDLCGHYSASFKYDLMKHLNLHLAQGQLKCIFCRKLFDDRESFRFHSRQVHGDPKNRIGLTKADLTCRTCGKEFDDVTARKKHEKSHEEKVQCPICDMKCRARCLVQHLKQHELNKKRNIFICDICGFKNMRKCILKSHLELHLNSDKAKCKICWKTFTSTQALKIHLRTIHSLNVEPSELCCNICNVKCKNLSAVRSHELTHKGPKTCPVCSKSIKPQSIFKHMKLHDLKKRRKEI